MAARKDLFLGNVELLLLMNIVLVEQNFLPKTCLLAMLMRSKDLTLYLTRFPLSKIYIPLIYNEKIPEKTPVEESRF